MGTGLWQASQTELQEKGEEAGENPGSLTWRGRERDLGTQAKLRPSAAGP